MDSSPAMRNATASGSGSGSGSNVSSSTFETKIDSPTSASSSGKLDVKGKEGAGVNNEDGDVEMGDAGGIQEGKEVEGDKVALPWAFIDCEIDSLIELVAHMLNKLLEHNDQVVLTPSALTRFHSRAPPGISVVDYLKRIVRYTNLEKLPLLSLLAYIDITCTNLPTFTLSSLTVHRFVISGITAGSKALCDVFCTNVHYAKVGGIRVGELNALEREFLRVTDWDLCVPAELIQQYYSSLIRSHGGFVQSEPPEKSPFTVFPLEGSTRKLWGKKGQPDDDSKEDEEMDVVQEQLPVRAGQTGSSEQDVVNVLRETLKADPSSLTPPTRESLLKRLLADLDEGNEKEQATSSAWSHDTYGLAMEVIKTLSRSTTSKTELTTMPALRILLRHAGLLPRDRHNAPETPPPPLRVRKEALSTIANTLFLHSSTTLSALSTLDAGRAIVEKIKEDQKGSDGTDDTLLFLYGRILMWMTSSKDSGFLQDLVDKQGLVDVIKRELERPYAANRKMAIEEILKTTYNVLALYPISSATPQWDALFGCLLEPITALFLSIPQTTLTPPLTYTINCLTRYSSPPSRIIYKLFQTIDEYFRERIGPWEPGDPVPPGERGREVSRVDEVVTPGLLVLGKLAKGNKKEIEKLLIPYDLDRTPGSKPLQSRSSLMGHLIRFLNSPNAERDAGLTLAIGEVFWGVCGGDPNELIDQIGYGNAAGLLFRRGFSQGPPERQAKVEELEDDEEASGLRDKRPRDPITGLEVDDPKTTAGSTGSGSSVGPGPGGALGIGMGAMGKGGATTATSPASPLAGNIITGIPSSSSSSSSAPESMMQEMTEEEKEREAERLMTLFQRMERNPAISLSTGAAGGGGGGGGAGTGTSGGPSSAMREMLESGKMERWQVEENERERKRVELEDEVDEEVALRELAGYKKRVKRA